MQQIEIEPGIYPDVPFKDYAAWNAMNVSKLKWGLKSAKHLQAAIDGRLGFADTPDRKLGRAIHCKLLEPDRYKSEFQVAGKCQAVLKSGSNKGKPCGLTGVVEVEGEWLCGKHGPTPEGESTILSVDEANRIERLNDSVRQHPVVKFLRQKGGAEISLCWEQDGVLMKARLDKLILREEYNAIIDLKKVQVGKGDLNSVQNAVANYDYHVQAAAYQCAVRQLCDVDPLFFWVFVEDNEPFDVSVIQADGATLDIGLFQFRRLVSMYREMQETLTNPDGYSSDIQQGGLPPWYFKQFEQSYESNHYA